MLTSAEAGDIAAVRQHTREVITNACKAENPVLVEAPPNSGKSTTAYKLPTFTDYQITYLTSRTDLYEEIVDGCEEEADLSYEVIPSPHRDCPTFMDNNHGSAPTVRRLYRRGRSGASLHYDDDVYTPCRAGNSDCPYIETWERIRDNIDSIDVLIGNHKHTYPSRYIDGRVVILDEFNPDPFLEVYPSDIGADKRDTATDIISHFLDQLREAEVEDFPTDIFTDVTDVLENRSNPVARARAIRWFQEHGITREKVQKYDFYEINNRPHQPTYLIAPFLTCSLFCMRKLTPGIEVAPSPDNDALREGWKKTDVDEKWKCVRDRNSGSLFALRPPDLSDAAQVVGLDGTPTVVLWNLIFAGDTEFTHRQVLRRQDFQKYLQSLNISTVQIGDGMHHYAGGNMNPKDGDRFTAIHAREQESLALISTKAVLKKYDRRGWLNRYVKRPSEEVDEDSDYSRLARHYGTLLSSNAFKSEHVGAVFGSPFPGRDVVKRWAALCGKGVVPEGTGEEKSFGEFGDKIYHHFTHNQVVQAVLRFGRDKSVWKDGGATVYISTEALPEWFEPEIRMTVEAGSKGALVIEELVQAKWSEDRSSLASQTVKTLEQRIAETPDQEAVSDTFIRDVLKTLQSSSIITVEEDKGRGGATLYTWDDDRHIRETPAGDEVVFTDDKVYILDTP
jgi:hypothetical protein